MKVLLWCMSVGHGWDHELSQKYEDYCSVMTANEEPYVAWTNPVVLLGTENPIYIREDGRPIPAPHPTLPEGVADALMHSMLLAS